MKVICVSNIYIDGEIKYYDLTIGKSYDVLGQPDKYPSNHWKNFQNDDVSYYNIFNDLKLIRSYNSDMFIPIEVHRDEQIDVLIQ